MVSSFIGFFVCHHFCQSFYAGIELCFREVTSIGLVAVEDDVRYAEVLLDALAAAARMVLLTISDTSIRNSARIIEEPLLSCSL